MTMHHLDPRRASEPDAKPDVVCESSGMGFGLFRWCTRGKGGSLDRSPFIYTSPTLALAAARHAAGFGHVAEQACGHFAYESSALERRKVLDLR